MEILKGKKYQFPLFVVVLVCVFDILSREHEGTERDTPSHGFLQENLRGQRGTLRALAVICHSH